eukprot:gene9735-10730_t
MNFNIALISLPFAEIDLLESFDFSKGIKGLEKSTAFASYPIYKFSKSKSDFIANKPITNEVLDFLAQHDNFIISMYVKPDPKNRGTLLWIQNRKTAQTLFGVWLRSGKRAKLSLPHFNNRKTEHATFSNIGDLSDGVWHYIVIHVRPSFGITRKVDVYHNCQKVGSMLSPFNYQNAFGGDYEMRLGQRGVRHFAMSKWQGSVFEFMITVNRDINRFVKSEKCDMQSKLAPNLRQELVAHSPALDKGISALGAASSSVVTKRELGSLLEAFKSGNKEDIVVKEILKIVKDVREIQSNQVGELKTLRQILQSLTTNGRAGPVWENITETKSDNKLSAERKGCDLKPCFPFVKCFNVKIAPWYQCGACPPGLSGNGINCTDIDECELKPCSPVTKCVNRRPGYVCTDCPSGYRGKATVGLGLKHAADNKQVCEDIDECLEGKHKCDPLAKCINQKGGYKCGQCKTGYAKNSVGKCRRIKLCHGRPGSKSNPCSMYAKCIEKDHSAFCECRIGFAGNGYICARDSDMDGYPDVALNCTEAACKKDNCPNVPNSGQEDLDKDGTGDVCDHDIDNDSIYNVHDNCPELSTKRQVDTDLDGVGDACDNCVFMYNPNQIDMDKDGIGDVCDEDVDGDGVSNANDNCPFKSNPDQSDKDRDRYGDVCDNCPDVKNSLQRDKNGNGYGDACDDNLDSDKDGILDRYDNCPLVQNAAQLDTDGDGKGDLCDKDDDGDGIPDSSDNCPLLSNSDQLDSNGNSIGDKCEKDADGDKIGDEDDVCPLNKNIQTTNFADSEEILLSKLDRNSQKFPKWVVRNQGKEVVQVKNSVPSILVGKTVYEGIDFTGTMFVQTRNDDDFIGFVFGYQSPRNFILVSWKQEGQKYWRSIRGHETEATSGLEIKVVDSKTGPGPHMRSALWHSGNYTDQTRLLWKDTRNRGWKDMVPYYFQLQHRPNNSIIRLQVYERSNLFIDTGFILANDIKAGKVGLYSFSQENVVWSNLRVECKDDVPSELLKLIRRT